MKSIKFDDVSYHYHNSDKGIQNFSLEISKGEFIAVIGKNGAGKSTFLSYVSKSGVRLFPYYLLAYIMPPLYKR